MAAFTKRLFQLSTPASAASFIVVATTGVLLFLHLAQRHVESLHEWAGLTLAGAAGLHVARNWRALLSYGRRGVSLYVSLAVAALGASAFLAAGFLGVERGGLDALRVRIEQAPLAALAPILGEAQTRLVTRLQQAGFEGVKAEATPKQIASASQQSERTVLEALVGGSRPKESDESRRR